MPASLSDSMFCPFCGGNFNAGELEHADFGILTCYCGEYPVVAGIPVIKKGAIGISNQTAADVISLIKTGRNREALLAMIMPPAPASPGLAPAWVQALPSVKGIRRLKYLFHQRATRGWRDQAAALLTDAGDTVTACDLLDLYYHRSGFKWNDAYDYFALRFGQPRHLVALSFATLIEQPEKSILDLACGYGHITRSLVLRARGQAVIGVDQNFIGLYFAKKFVAPEADYVCCVADGPLPFPDNYFAAAFCSDAFHYFQNKLTSLRELKRLTHQDGMIIMVWIHNLLWRRPNDGLPLRPEGYEAIFADIPHRMVGDTEVLDRYLRKQGPPLACLPDMERLSQEPLLSVVATRREEVFKDHGSFEEWPHGEGRLALNPLYRIENGLKPVNGVQLRRTFPSAFYMEDHAQAKDYLPETVKVDSRVLADLAQGERTPEVEGLVQQFVALGMPERYCRVA